MRFLSSQIQMATAQSGYIRMEKDTDRFIADDDNVVTSCLLAIASMKSCTARSKIVQSLSGMTQI